MGERAGPRDGRATLEAGDLSTHVKVEFVRLDTEAGPRPHCLRETHFKVETGAASTVKLGRTCAVHMLNESRVTVWVSEQTQQMAHPTSMGLPSG